MVIKFNRPKQRIFTFLMAVLFTAGFINNSVALAFDIPFFSSNSIHYYDDSDCDAANGIIPSSPAGGGDISGVTPSQPSANLKEFVTTHIDAAIEVGQKYGIPYEAILGQGAHESGLGKSKLSAEYNNFFGIKANSSWKGQKVLMKTQEEMSGRNVTIDDYFRVYPNAKEGWDGYGQFITGNSRYKGALQYPTDPFQYIVEIKKAGYATDSAYVDKNHKIIRQIVEIAKEIGKQPSSVTNANITPGAGGGGDQEGGDAPTDPATPTTPSGGAGCCVTGATNTQTGVLLSGKNNQEKILNFLMGKGLTLTQAAGFVGNIFEESAETFDPRIVQGMSRADSPVSGKGYGLIQWTDGGRQSGLVKKANEMKKKPGDLEVQLEFMWQELNSGTYKTLDQLKTEISGSNATNARLAALIVHGRKPSSKYGLGYEASAKLGQDDAIMNGRRGDYATQMYDKYKDAPPIGATSPSQPVTNTPPADGAENPEPSQPGGDQITIALSPGHGPNNVVTDKETGVVMRESHNKPETENVWQVSQLLKTKLEKDGFKVVMVKNSVDEKVSFKDRAQRAEQAGADLGVSIHTDATIGYAAAQHQNAYRYKSPEAPINDSGKDTDKVIFNSPEVAAASQEYNKKIAAARSKFEKGKEVKYITTEAEQLSFGKGRSGIAHGNIAYEMLFSTKVPWSYNEFALNKGFTPEKYAQSLYEGIKAAGVKDASNLAGDTPTDAKNQCAGASGSGGSGSSASSGSVQALQDTVKKFAWPDYHSKPYLTKKPEYDAWLNANPKEYRGGCNGVDCGAFVHSVMVASGWDPGFGNGTGYTVALRKWLPENWQTVGNGNSLKIEDLQPGDVGIRPGHVHMFVGDIPGFNSKFASASQCGRAPMAGGEKSPKGYMWYRKK